jgi:pimeloyl-ACP methyl ester carboxylesterase
VLERTIEVGPRGLRLVCCEWPGSGERPLVVLHGYLEQGAAWDRVAKALGRWVLAPDQRGHGRSDHVGAGGWYHFWDYVGDVDAIVETLGGPVDLVGHSMGGTVACLYAGCRPANVRRLVLVEGLGPPDSTAEAVSRARHYLDGRRRPPSHGAIANPAEAAARMQRFNPRLPLDVAQELATRTLSPTEAGYSWSWDPLHRARSPVPFAVDTFRRFLAEITAPVLAVDGADTPFVLPDRPERLAAFRSRVREVRVANAGHLVHHDAPEALARVIGEFLSESS